MPERLRATWWLLLISGCLSGCELLGPRVIEAGRTDYNAAAKSTNAEQLLLNIVRARFNDQPYFLEVASISATAEAGAGFGGTAEKGLDAGVRYSERPTVIYTPLTGEAFVHQLLSPIDLRTLLLLREAGWELDDILAVFADQVNGVRNASTGADSTPEGVPEFEDFKNLNRVIDELEDNDYFRLAADPTDQATYYLVIDDAARGTRAFEEFTRILGVDSELSTYVFHIGLHKNLENEIVIQTRPFLSALFFIGQHVEVPAHLIETGGVHFAVDEDGKPFDWEQVHDDLIRVRSSRNEPKDEDVYAKVRYFGDWYYVDSNDVDSRETMSMLSVVLMLKSGDVASERPLLTLPVTGN